ncbi:NusG antitermination factor [Ferroglobus placidus DSM 10642]|uniref:Transcription elongation factor Spt5 n=1 Tax=Ferroglobus placidus (strain DSM 10642 / AEDII12DO) TaxID=589924 RepID=D3RYE0_FERPA|nr:MULTISPECIES: transcription elongation factor Spt5 [Ferroglobus]ADC65503.1 NusG antitermination factor [Ferroglobus placidus DSM 10642]
MSRFFVVKTTANQERLVANMMSMVAKKNKANVYSILAPKELKGYVIVEAESTEDLVKSIRGVPHVKGLVRGEVSFNEIEHFLTPRKAAEQIKEGYTVEIISGPFKGELAVVKRVDEARNEITVELIEAVVSIPITVKADHVRVVDKKEEVE